MRYKKGQGLPLEKMIKLILVIFAGLLIFLAVSTGFIKNALDSLWDVTDNELEGVDIRGDYIKRAVANIIDEQTVALEFSLDSSHCGEINQGANQAVIIQEGFAPFPSDAIEWNQVNTATSGDTCTTQYTLSGDNAIPLSHPGEVGKRKIRLDVKGKDGAILESMDIDLEYWKVLLHRYLNHDMGRSVEHVANPHGDATDWSLVMHGMDNLIVNTCDQSMNLAESTLNDIRDLLGRQGNSIEDIAFSQGTFKEFIITLGCADQADTSLKQKTLQIMITAMFDDIQDLNEETIYDASVGQPVARLRRGIGVRGYTKGDWENQLLPLYIDVRYPAHGQESAFDIHGEVRKHECSSNWDKEFGASITFETGSQSCFEGEEIRVDLYRCPLDKCRFE